MKKLEKEIQRMILRGLEPGSIKEKIEELIFANIEQNNYACSLTIANDNFCIEVEGGNYYVSSAVAKIFPDSNDDNGITMALNIDKINVWLEAAETAGEAMDRTMDYLTNDYWRTRL